MAGDFDFSADHIAAASGAYEPQRLNHFVVRFAGLGTSKVIEKSLSSFTPPKRQIAAVTIPYANEERKVAGKVTVANASLVITDYVDKDTWKDFHDWLDKVHDVRTGAIGYAKDYKKEGKIHYYGPNAETKRSWISSGCFPLSIESGQFSMDVADVNTLTVDMSVDRILPAESA